MVNRAGRHPRLSRSLPLWISQRSITRIVLIFLAVEFALSVILALFVMWLRPDHPGFVEGFRASSSSLYSIHDIMEDVPNDAYGLLAVAWVTQILGILLPVFLLGAFVFRLFL